MIYLTQQKLLQKLGDDLELHIGTKTLHALVDAGLPFKQVGKRKKFHWESVRAWMLTQQTNDPAVAQARDSLFRRRMRSAS